MQTIAIFLAMFVSLFTACTAALLPLWMSGKRWQEAQDKARARRIADARMNARLLRFNL